ncbi:hypothetical protein ACTFIW_006971 [Dictyostelium discoideum]
MEITISIPDNLISHYLTFFLLVSTLLYILITQKKANAINNNSNNSNNNNNNNFNNSSNNSNADNSLCMKTQTLNKNSGTITDSTNNNFDNNINNNLNKNNYNSEKKNKLIKNEIKGDIISNNNNNSNSSSNNNNNNPSPLSLYSKKELIPLPVIQEESNNYQNNNNNKTNNNKPNLKVTLNNNNNNNTTTTEPTKRIVSTSSSSSSSSDDEEPIPISPVSNSFLSPLNFTTGKKKSKKNQFYYVSTYYSSCDLPNKVMDENEIEEEDNNNISNNNNKPSNNNKKSNFSSHDDGYSNLLKQENKNSDLLNKGFRYNRGNNNNNNKHPQQAQQQPPPPPPIKLLLEDEPSLKALELNPQLTDTTTTTPPTSSTTPNAPLSMNSLESSSNLLKSTNLNKPQKNSISKSLDDFMHEEHPNQISSPIESCIKKLKKKKCILPQVLQLKWRVKPKKVLIIKKYNDETINELIPGLVGWLKDIGIKVMKESDSNDEYPLINDDPAIEVLSSTADPYSIDFIISMGGDGTILHTSSLFKTYIPPILSFSLGSLGFLTAFDYSHHKEYIQSVIDGKCFVSYRLRLSCTVVTSDGNVTTTTISTPTSTSTTTTTTTTKPINPTSSDSSTNANNTPSGDSASSGLINIGSNINRHRYQVLNEVTIDRGTNPYLSNLECCCDGKLITIVQADGLIIATSTGSTAYSLSAGGSLVHPTIPAILITPICPHTLSFRPVILPSTSELIIRVPETSRCPVWASFDGKNRQELKRGDYVIIKTSRWAVPVVCKTDESNEWFEKLAQNLNWNLRQVQKSFTAPHGGSISSGSSGENSNNSSPLNLSTSSQNSYSNSPH